MTASTIANSRDGPAQFSGTAAIICVGYAAIALALLHVLRADYSPTNHMISDYAVGPYGWIMQTVFVGMSIGGVMLVVGLARSGPTSLAARTAIVLLAVASIGFIIFALFPTDVAGSSRTRSGHIHALSFLVNIPSLSFAVVLLTASFGQDPRWRLYQRTSAILLSLIALAFVLQVLTLRIGVRYGLANRFFVCVLFTWAIATANQLRHLTRLDAAFMSEGV